MVYLTALFLEWQQLAIMCIAVSILLIPLLMIAPESHIWLLSNGREEDARKSLQWFYGDHYDIDDELQECIDHHADTKKAITSWRDIVRFGRTI